MDYDPGIGARHVLEGGKGYGGPWAPEAKGFRQLNPTPAGYLVTAPCLACWQIPLAITLTVVAPSL